MAIDETPTAQITVASISMDQTVYDFTTNIRNGFAAIDRGVADHADIITFSELWMTGYAADDGHQWNKNNGAVWPLIQLFAKYAAAKDPNLVLLVGTPWHYADKTLPADDPAYNINNRPFNCQFTITDGQVVAISAKSILADGAAEYEPRQFNDWPLNKGTISIPLPDGAVVPFGKPIILLSDGEKNITLTCEICAEGWPGVHDDLTIDQREQDEVRHIITLARDNDLSVVVNSSASKPQPAINKEAIRAKGLCETGSRYCGLYVYTNYLGSESGTYAAEGSQLFAQDGEIIHHGQRYSFADVSYSSVTVDVPIARRGKPHVTVHHDYKNRPSLKPAGHEANFDAAYRNGEITNEQLKYEEYMRSIALWLRDYLVKQDWPCQGYVISLSGGKDSAYGAVAVSMMVDLEVQENGVEGFFKRFNRLKYKDEVLGIFENEGEAAAIRAIKDRILTCVYLPSDNSSDRTLNAARSLIEGGELNDAHAEGIGGKFQVSPVQGMMDEQIAGYAGLNLSRIAEENWQEILGDSMRDSDLESSHALARAKMMRDIRSHVNAEPGSTPILPDYIARHCVNPVPTWANPADDITLQNIQARVRLPIPWTIANHEAKMALVTSNESEAVLGYTTAGGDMHMGGANPIGGVPKATITESLDYFEHHGLVGLPPTASLFYVNHEKPSAELRKEVEGAVQQTDETDLGFTYKQSAYLEEQLIVGRRQPAEVIQDMRNNPLFTDDPAVLRDIMLGFTGRWASAQFKRVMGTLAPHVGGNVDPHQAVRTTVLGDHFKTGCAEMTLDILAEKLGGDGAFENAYGVNTDAARILAMVNPDFKTALVKWPLDRLLNPNEWRIFDASNAQFTPYLGQFNYSTATASAVPKFDAGI